MFPDLTIINFRDHRADIVSLYSALHSLNPDEPFDLEPFFSALIGWRFAHPLQEAPEPLELFDIVDATYPSIEGIEACTGTLSALTKDFFDQLNVHPWINELLGLSVLGLRNMSCLIIGKMSTHMTELVQQAKGAPCASALPTNGLSQARHLPAQ